MKLNSLVQNWPKMKRRCQTVAYRGSRIIKKLKTQETSQSSVGFRLYTDVGGQHCPCPVLVSFLSWFSIKSCLVSVCCPDFLSGVCLSGFCLSRFCQLSRFCPLSGFCPDYRKKAARCLSVRPDKDETQLSGLSLYLSADVWIKPNFAISKTDIQGRTVLLERYCISKKTGFENFGWYSMDRMILKLKSELPKV